jgi:hypothetical protein
MSVSPKRRHQGASYSLPHLCGRWQQPANKRNKQHPRRDVLIIHGQGLNRPRLEVSLYHISARFDTLFKPNRRLTVLLASLYVGRDVRAPTTQQSEGQGPTAAEQEQK